MSIYYRTWDGRWRDIKFSSQLMAQSHVWLFYAWCTMGVLSLIFSLWMENVIGWKILNINLRYLSNGWSNLLVVMTLLAQLTLQYLCAIYWLTYNVICHTPTDYRFSICCILKQSSKYGADEFLKHINTCFLDANLFSPGRDQNADIFCHCATHSNGKPEFSLPRVLIYRASQKYFESTGYYGVSKVETAFS